MPSGKHELNAAYGALEREAPDWLTRVLRRAREPQARWVRVPLGLLFIACGFFWYLPVVGIEFVPIGLLLLAQDVPFLRKPMARCVFWLEVQWLRLKWRWQHRRQR